MGLDNLVSALSNYASGRRAFYPPIAALPPGRNATNTVDKSQFTLSDDWTKPHDPVFKIQINPNPPLGGSYRNDGDLPDAAYRLHAVDKGGLWLRLSSPTTMRPHLILEMLTFPLIEKRLCRWWERWTEVEGYAAIPHLLVYENIDIPELTTLVTNLVTRPHFYGLALPSNVAFNKRQEHIDNFLAGNGEYPLVVLEPGAVIGTAARDPKEGVPPTQRLVRLHACYYGAYLTDISPRPKVSPHQFDVMQHVHGLSTPMNPRELLYLLFGNDSQEADPDAGTPHPLLARMEERGQQQQQQDGMMPSRTMRLRPPLRTWARVQWEVNQEFFSGHRAAWGVAGNVANRLYNTETREGRFFDKSGYAGMPKVSLFTADFAIRSGFRSVIKPVFPSFWQYWSASEYANKVHQAGSGTNYKLLRGKIEGQDVTWGRKIEGRLRANISVMGNELEKATFYEGRCLILAGARATWNGNQAINHHKPGFTGFYGPLVPFTEPTFMEEPGEGLATIGMKPAYAGPDELIFADYINFTATAQRMPGHNYTWNNFSRLHLFELHPGGDPDTEKGLKNLNVQAAEDQTS